ncbi:probable proteasome inhibitor [Chenopodium quinoa]|uniref:probable proteasome inhibitor n=1 Tax=Chenopodium quinoa TaxID=63459 RepID=UPI000B770273|nr:probable proteasome inhibitor [Chenopodium quinoa]
MVTEESVMLVIRASRPNFRNNHDKLAFAVHSSFLAAGYVLTATGPPAFAENSLSSSSSNDEVGIDHWNEVEIGYAFVYKNPKKGNKKVLVKCLVIGDKLMVDALSDGASEPVHLGISVDDYVTETAASDYPAQYKNLGKLVSSLESNVLSKLDGSSPGGSVTAPSRLSADEEANRYPDGSTGSQDPQTGFVVPPVSPFGGSDLYPGPGAGMYPSRGDFGSGSMLIGPEDPRWLGDRGGFPGISGGPGGLGIPPGARYDPYGPPGVPGFEPDRFGRFPRGPNPGRGGRRGGIHPDIEQPGSGGFDYI